MALTPGVRLVVLGTPGAPADDDTTAVMTALAAAGVSLESRTVVDEDETALERYPGAVLVPLSAFDPSAIPDPQGREVVFACRSGRRSVTASLAAQEQGYPYGCHLAGGILAWKAAGLPTET